MRIDKNSQQLREALSGNTARIIITTLQKFPVIAEAAEKVAGQRFAVIVDEAHSSTGGEAMKDLKSVLASNSVVEEAFAEVLAAHEAAEKQVEDSEKDFIDLVEESMVARGRQANLSFFAFTATPKPKTLELFGDRVTVPGGVELFKPSHIRHSDTPGCSV